MRHVAGGRAIERTAASTILMGRFETQILTQSKNLELLMGLPGKWVDRVHQRKLVKQIILDMDSSVSPTYGNQEGTAYNGWMICETAEKRAEGMEGNGGGLPRKWVLDVYARLLGGFRHDMLEFSRQI